MVPVVIALVLAAAPLLVSPQNNTTVNSSRLEWQIPSYSLYNNGSPYMVEVDDQESFADPEKDNIYRTNNYYTPQLNPGLWYWRVKAKDSSGTWSDWSNIWSFTLIEATPTPEPTPTPTATTTSIPTQTPTSKPTSIPTPKKTTVPSPAILITETPLPTEAATEIPSKKIVLAAKPDYKIASVAAASTSSQSASTQIKPLVKQEVGINPLIWVGVFSLFAGAGGVGYIYLKSNGKIHFPFRK